MKMAIVEVSMQRAGVPLESRCLTPNAFCRKSAIIIKTDSWNSRLSKPQSKIHSVDPTEILLDLLLMLQVLTVTDI